MSALPNPTLYPFNSQRDKLKEQYKTLVNLMKEDMTASSVEFYMIENEYYEELI